MYAPLTLRTFPLRPLLVHDGKQYCGDYCTVSTWNALCSHRPPQFHKIYFLIHRSEPQTYAACRKMSLLSALHYLLQWTLIQTLMPQMSYDSWWTRLLVHYCKTTACRSEIVSSQCHQHYLRQQKMRWHEVASCNWHIPLDRLIRVPIKLLPVKLLKPVFSDGRMFRVKTQLFLWMRLQISKDMECLLKVTDSGNHEVAQ